MRAEDARRFKLAFINLPQPGHQRTHHQRGEDGHFRQYDPLNRIEKIHRRQFKSKQRHQRPVQQTGGAVNKGESQGDEKGRQRNKGINYPANQLATGKRDKHQNQRQYAAEQQTA